MITVTVNGEGYGLPLGNDTFVNLLANDIWSDTDITNRTESIVRCSFPATEETIINRDISGMGFGIPLSPEQYAQVVAMKTLLLQTRELGRKARTDMVLLLAAMKVQAALVRLDAEVVEDDAEDEAARLEAQAVVDAASDDAVLLAEVRLGRWQPIEE